jgi:hypothetical protein
MAHQSPLETTAKNVITSYGYVKSSMLAHAEVMKKMSAGNQKENIQGRLRS